MESETFEQPVAEGADDARGVPGVVLLWSAGQPVMRASPTPAAGLTLGRGDGDGRAADRAMSRAHAQVAPAGTEWLVRDLDSRNGTFVDGARTASGLAREGQVIRTGDSLWLLVGDVTRFLARHDDDEVVRGPTLERAWQAIARAAAGAPTLHLTGETGAGKELAARAFHDRGPRPRGPFVPVNCATIPDAVAERLLFGARRGAFSGAHADAIGHVQAADGGTLFLDEIGELSPLVQAKLLRVLETREVLALGATSAQRVDLRVVSATHRDLRALVAEGRFRDDLFFRLGRPHVALPPLRARREDIGFLVERVLAGSLVPRVTFVEQCLLRPWPGNVRELRTEVQEAARRAQAEGGELAALAADAGLALVAPAGATEVAAAAEDEKLGAHALPPREVIEAMLRREHGKVAVVARQLNVHRNTLRRWLARHGVDVDG